MDARLKVNLFSKLMHLGMLGLVFLVFGFSLLAQESNEISYGMTVDGNIQAGETQDWQFIGFDGAFVSILVISKTELDPVVTLRNQAGEILLQNDDYVYPIIRDALLEGFTLPRSGEYTISVSGFGDTAGTYQLTMLPGYSELEMIDDFRDRVGWEGVDLLEYDAPFIDQQNDYLQLELEGIAQQAIVFPTGIESLTHYYAQVDVEVASSRNGWIIGIVLGYRDSSNYQMIQIDHEGTWRVVAVRDNEESDLRVWSSHPAIRAGVSEFSLGVLANENTLDVFYNTAYLGSVSHELLTGTGQVGLMAGTTNTIASHTSVQYDNFIFTVPREVGGERIRAESVLVTNELAKNLERRLVIPAGGFPAFEISESFIQDRDAGVTTLGIGQGAELTNFALGTEISWDIATDGLHGCGMIFRSTDDESAYTLAFVDNNGGYGIAEHEDNAFQTIFFAENPLLLEQETIHLLIIAVDDVVKLYIDGQYISTQENTAIAGTISNAVINFDLGTTSCQFRDTWVWSLD